MVAVLWNCSIQMCEIFFKHKNSSSGYLNFCQWCFTSQLKKNRRLKHFNFMPFTNFYSGDCLVNWSQGVTFLSLKLHSKMHSVCIHVWCLYRNQDAAPAAFYENVCCGFSNHQYFRLLKKRHKMSWLHCLVMPLNTYSQRERRITFTFCELYKLRIFASVVTEREA